MTKNPGGRPPQLTADEKTLKLVQGLGTIRATTKECAAVLSVTEPTFLKFLKDHPQAQEAFEIGKGQGKVSLVGRSGRLLRPTGAWPRFARLGRTPPKRVFLQESNEQVS